MRVLLVSANTEKINMPVFPLGLAFVATAVRQAGHEVEFINLMDEDSRPGLLREGIRNFRPEVIGISVRNIDDQSRLETKFLLEKARLVVDECRTLSGAPIVLGGAGYSIFPRSALNYLQADMGIQGEGERALPLLLERLEKKADPAGLPGLFLPGGEGSKPDCHRRFDDFRIPWPSTFPWIPDSAKNDRSAWIPFQTRRGCPLDCSYCSTGSIEGRLLRMQSPVNAVRALAEYAGAGYERLQFVDNTFNLPPSYAESLCDGIIAAGLNIKWLAIIYPIGIRERLIEKMARAGCVGASIGSESGSDRILRGMNKRFSTGQIRLTASLMKKHGLRRMGFLLLGGPGEDKESVRESLEFTDSLDLESVKITMGIRIYPSTALAKQAVREGAIDPDDDLLQPRFYLARGLEDWLQATVEEWLKNRPHWMT